MGTGGNQIPLVFDAAYCIGNGQADQTKLHEVAGALNCMHDQQAVIHATEQWMARRFTPRECERLQGFPDDWTKYGADGKEISDTARYKALGNSIAIPCALRVIGYIADYERRT